MRKLIVLLVGLFISELGFAQNNVGIGTTNPSSNAILHLENGASDLGLLLPNVDISGFTPAGTDEGLMVYNIPDNKIYIWTGGTWVSSTSEWGVNANNIFNLNSGNVGIGTNTPIQKFHVFNPTGFDGILIESADPTGGSLLAFINDNPAVFAQIGLNGSTNGIYPDAFFLTQNGNHPIKFGTNFIDRMIITGSGDIGIGTLNPVARLTVQNTISTGSQRGTLLSYSNNNSASNAIVAVGSSTGLSSGLIYSRAHLAGYGQGPLGFFDYGVWGHVPNGTWGVFASHGPDSLAPSTYAALGGATHSGIFMGGNVGIGTTSPLDLLQITTSNSSIRMGTWSQGATYNIIDLKGSNGLDYNLLSSSTDPNLYINRPTGRDIRFRMNNSDQMTLNSAGNLGVGTNAPTATLHVIGTGIYTGRVEMTATNDASGTANSGVLEIANALRIDGNEIITNFNSPLYLQNDNNGDLIVDGNTLFVDASTNNVGIGTAAPGAKLHVNGPMISTGGYATFCTTLDNSSGNVAMGGGGYNNVKLTVSSNQAFGLYVENAANQAIYAVGPAGGTTGWNGASDERYKKNITPLVNSMDLIKRLQGVNYFYRTETFPEKFVDTSQQVGLIAQDVQKVLPEVVHQFPDGYYGVDYAGIVPVLIEALKEQQTRIEELEKLVKGN